MMKNQTLLLSTLFFAISLALHAQAPKYSNEFLNIGVGARGLAMSKAQVATVNDVTAAYWNPAGMTGIENNLQVAAQHAEYFAGIAKYDYGALAAKIDEKSNLGISFVRFGVDDIPNTTELIDQNGQINYDRITSFSAADYAFLLSYARKFSDKLSVGGNAKVIYRQVGSFAHAWGFGIDLGAQYKLGNWRLGAMAKDVTTTYNAWNFTLSDRTIEIFQQTGNTVPSNGAEITLPSLIIGGGREFVFKEKFSVLTELNAQITTDGKRNVLISGNPFSIAPNLGLELSYNKMFYVRGGIGNAQRIKAQIGSYSEFTLQPNIGIGIVLKDLLSIDYALTDIGDQSVALYSNVFSLKVAINKK